jgi:hypothetical protein
MSSAELLQVFIYHQAWDIHLIWQELFKLVVWWWWVEPMHAVRIALAFKMFKMMHMACSADLQDFSFQTALVSGCCEII